MSLLRRLVCLLLGHSIAVSFWSVPDRVRCTRCGRVEPIA